MDNTKRFSRKSALFDDTADIVNEESPNVDMNFFETPTSGNYSSNDFSNENNDFENNTQQNNSFFNSNSLGNITNDFSNFSTGNQATDFLIGAGMEKLYGTGNEMISEGVLKLKFLIFFFQKKGRKICFVFWRF